MCQSGRRNRVHPRAGPDPGGGDRAQADCGPGRPDPTTVAKVGEPSGTNTFRVAEVPYHNPPEMVRVGPGQPLDVSQLDAGRKYLWVVDRDGYVIVAPEEQEGFGVNQMNPDGRDVKHGDMVPGEGGQTRGEARAGGELFFRRDQWIMNNDSSYTFNRTDGYEGTEDNLLAAHDLLRRSGTNVSVIAPVNSHGAQ